MQLLVGYEVYIDKRTARAGKITSIIKKTL